MRLVLALIAVFFTGPVLAQGTVLVSKQFDSRALGHPMAYSIYLPEGHANAMERFPVLYLLHGLGGGETDWIKAGGVAHTADRLIASGEIDPLVIVMPDGSDSWYVNSKARGGPGDFETAIGTDLQDHIEKTYPIRTDRNGRAIAGLSMGGFGAMRFAMTAPGRYVAAVSLSGAIVTDDTPETPLSQQQIKLFRKAFGTPFDAETFNAENLFRYLDRLAASPQKPALLITVGDDDYFKLYDGAFALFKALKSANIPNEFRVTDGNHSWRLWSQELETALMFVDAAWKN